MNCIVPNCYYKSSALQKCKYHYLREYKQKPEYRAIHGARRKVRDASPSRRYQELKRLSKLKSRECSIEFDQFVQIINSKCHYCKVDLKDAIKFGCCMDRKDCSKGYTPENVLPCCTDCNQLRGHRLTVEETEVAVRAIVEYRLKE